MCVNGSKPSIADCVIVPQAFKFSAGFIDHVPVTSLDAYPKIQAYLQRFLAIPEVAAYYADLEAKKAAAAAK